MEKVKALKMPERLRIDEVEGPFTGHTSQGLIYSPPRSRELVISGEGLDDNPLALLASSEHEALGRGESGRVPFYGWI